MKKNILASTVLIIVGASMAGNVYAKAEWSAKFGVGCESCHSSANGNDGNVKGAAKSAYKSAGLNGLQKFLSGNGGGGTPVTSNTRPVVGAIALEWDVEAGQALSIPLSISDTEQDAFQIIGKFPLGSTLSAEYTASNNLPTVDFEWTPTADQANKVYTVKFKAKETATTKKLTSLPVTAKIRVWPAGDREQAYVKKLVVSKTKWVAGKLALKGKIVLNKIMTASEKAAFLNSGLSANITEGSDGLGAVIVNSLPLSTIDAKGNWAVADIDLPVDPIFSCNATIELDGAKASRKIAGAPKDCIK